MARTVRPIAPEQLRWRASQLDVRCLGTEEIRPEDPVNFQPTARQALEHAFVFPGLHVFVRGPEGSGRLDLVRQVFEQVDSPSEPMDLGYVHNFRQPERPRLLSFPAGQGQRFANRLSQFAEFVEDQLHDVLSGDPLRSRRQALQRSLEAKIRKITDPLEKKLEAQGMTLVRVQNGPVSDFMIFPTVMDRPVPPEQLEELAEQGQISEKFRDQFFKRRESHEAELRKVDTQARKVWRKGLAEMESFRRREAGRLLSRYTGDLFEPFKGDEVRTWLKDLMDDVLDRHAPREGMLEPADSRLYDINLVYQVRDPEQSPLVVENAPTLTTLAGTPAADAPSSQPAYLSLRAGSLVTASGGCLVLGAGDLLADPDGLSTLLRALRYGQIKPVFGKAAACNPDPIPLNLRVVVVGTDSEHHELQERFADFPGVFRVLADFDSMLPRDADGAAAYGAMATRIVDKQSLLPVSSSGMEALLEEGAHRGAASGHLSGQFGWMTDRLLEADRLARAEKEKEISRTHCESALRMDRRRRELPVRNRLARLPGQDPALAVRGRATGQCNAFLPAPVEHPGLPLPARMTATVGPAQQMNILFQETSEPVLPGLVYHLFKPDFPPGFEARLRVETPSLAEVVTTAGLGGLVCLISALSGVSLRQDLALAGALDQHGHVLPVPGINECIRNFFRLSEQLGATGDQGIIIPKANTADLAIDGAVEKACRNQRFSIYPVDNALQALEMVSGQPAGSLVEGRYQKESTLGRVAGRLRELAN